MERYYYIGLDIHKRIIAYCVKAIDGHLIDQGKIGADRQSLRACMKGLPGPWIGAMEATMFTGIVLHDVSHSNDDTDIGIVYFRSYSSVIVAKVANQPHGSLCRLHQPCQAGHIQFPAKS